MEDSFLEYRDNTDVESESDTEMIDNSLLTDDSYSKKKTTKNHTVFIAESEDSDETDCEKKGTNAKAVLRKSKIAKPQSLCSSDDDANEASSVRGKSEMSVNGSVIQSSDEESKSPELMPKRRPPSHTKLSNSSRSSFIGRKVKKRMILDSDTDNSFIMENYKNRKQVCLKDTPLKVDSGKITLDRKFDNSVTREGEESGEDIEDSGEESGDTEEENEESDDENAQSGENNQSYREKRVSGNKNKVSDEGDGESDVDDSEDDGPDEDQMLMSRATRMSIMGVMPKENDSDDSDYIQSDESNLRSCSSKGSVNSLTELPDVGLSMCQAEDRTTVNDNNGDTSNLTCSPFNSPLKDVTNTTPRIEKKNDYYGLGNKDENALAINGDNTKGKNLRDKVIDRLMLEDSKEAIMENVFRVCDDEDDVTIIDSKPEIIALSSDDDEVTVTQIKSPKPSRSKDSDKKSPRPKKDSKSPLPKKDSKSPLPKKDSKSPLPKKDSKSPRPKKDSEIVQYLVPESAPNQVQYVKQAVRDAEVRRLVGLREDLKNIKSLVETMDIGSLPDRGVKLRERQASLEREVRLQGDRVAALVVLPDGPSAKGTSRDGVDEEKGLSWDDIQKASNAVLPKTFGKNALASHMVERNLILERLRDLHESLASRPPETQLAAQPALLRARLMPHQLHALAWLRWRETQRPAGGILADDMGLGKTITMISLILDDKERGHGDDDSDEGGSGRSRLVRGGTLVVCPATLMQQWAAEVGAHCRPHALTVLQHHGPQRTTHPHRLAAPDLVLTTYNLLQRESEKPGVLSRVRWRRVILDEAHIVRNHKSATSRAVSALSARRRWALTGTPVHNKDLDLFALLKFLRCTPFDDLGMWKKWIDNKSLGGQERLNTIMQCVLLRRTKQQLQRRGELACLPRRTAHRVLVTLTRDEMNVYQKVLVFSKTLFAQFLHQRAEKQASAEGPLPPHKDNAYAKMHKRMVALQGAKPVKSHEILVLLLRLRQLCCHCGLIAAMLNDEDVDAGAGAFVDDGSQDLLAELNRLTLQEKRGEKSAAPEEEDEEETGEQEGTSVAEAIRSVLSTRNPVFDMSRLSSKIEAVMRCLRENVFANKGDKAVVVSQWTSVLQLVQRRLEAERVRCVTLSGQVPVAQRAPLLAAINEPQSGVQVLLLSLCAGGVGLNLCGANHLLLVDPHWNPQLEEQAQDRIYRVGQTKPVHIYRFICIDTVEQTIRNLQEAKLELADNVLTGAKNTNASKLSIEDLKMLFNMGT